MRLRTNTENLTKCKQNNSSRQTSDVYRHSSSGSVGSIVGMGTQLKPIPEALVIQGNTQFSNSVYQILSKKEGNVFFSPISIHAALSMLSQGAEGDTAQVLSDVLKNPDPKSTAEGYKCLLVRHNSVKEVSLLMANKMYGKQNETKLRKEFAGAVKNFESEIEFLDFQNKKIAAQAINKWVEEKTQHKIKNLVNENSLSENISLMMISAIYFKGEWMSKFRESLTKNAKFFVEQDLSVQVKMMYQKANYSYALNNELKAQIIELPYKGFHFKMMIALPEKNTTIKDLEASLAKINLEQIREKLESKDIHLFLPKFKMEETIKLNDILSQIGLKNIFDANKANFKGILDTTVLKDNLYVSEVVQKAFIDVNEAGTVAAAATRVGMMVGSAPGAPQPIIFKVDRPAIFMLLSVFDEVPTILFYGRLSDPSY